MANEYQQRYSASDTTTAGGFLFDDDDAGKDVGISKIVFGADGAAITRVSGGNGTAATALRVTLASDSTGVLAATQSGTWNVTNISGTISLPTGAATAAKQPALGTAGTASSDVITVQGIASMTALKVDGSAVTQPVSGTFWQATQPVSLTSTTITGTVAVTQSGTWDEVGINDSGNSITVDAPVATPVYVRLSDGASAISTLPVSLASVPSHAVTNAGTFAVQAAQSGTWTVDLGTTDNAVLDAIAASLAGTLTVGSHAVTNAGTFAVQSTLQAGTNYAGKLRLTDGTTDAEVVPLTGYNAQAVAIVDGSGNQITSFGGGTQYTEDAAAAANPVGTVPILVRADAPGGISDTDGDNVAQRGTNYGAAYVTILNNAGTSVDFSTESTLSTLNGKVTACNTGAVTISAALPAGTNAIGKLAANSGVDIGDVDITSVTPGTSATSLGKAEDGAHTSGDVGVMMLAVQNAGPTNLAGSAGDYEPLQISAGRVWTSAVIDTALPAGTNLIGRTASSDETSTIYSGTTALTPKYAVIAASSSGNNTLVAGVTSKKIRVVAYNLIGNGAVNAKFQSGASGTDLTGLKYIAAAGGGISASYNPVGWFETGSGVLLNLNLSGAVAVGGELVYVEV